MTAAVSLAIFSLIIASVAGQTCLNGWTYYEGSCYILGSQLLTWADAEQICRMTGADLAVVETAAENAFLKRYLSERHATTQSWRAEVWIGATDLFQEGQFLWVNSQENLSFADWAPGEPNSDSGPNSEDCVQMRRQDQWRWNDKNCAARSYFMCEMGSMGGDLIG